MSNAEKPIVSIISGSKVYGGVHAIQDVDFAVRPGEVHALVGENGAGKSTLSKSIAGTIKLTQGTIEVDGVPVTFETPADALRQGIAMVYQETSLVPTMTVAQNIELGNEKFYNRFRPLNIKAQQHLQSRNFHVDPAAMVSSLGAAQRQMVEIARALRFNARVIIFDEPTASLTPEEILHFFHLIDDLRSNGVGIVYISHALEESLQIADQITVLRDGKVIECKPADEFDRDSLVRAMVGRDVSQSHYAQTKHVSDTKQTVRRKVLSVENVTMGSAVKNMSFSVYAGEVVAMSGLIGSGRTEIAKVVCGEFKRNLINGGMIYLNGKAVRYRVPGQAIDDGIVYISEDRKVNGFFETMTVDDNIYLGRLATRLGRRIFTSNAQRQTLADAWVETLNISSTHRDAKISELSGGNQQKVMISKALVQEPELVIFDEPTRGVDVGTIPVIHETIRNLAAEGKAVLVISSYLPEVLSIGDRILVARQGRIVEEFDAATASEDKIMYAAIH
ncbi:MAG: sugar ABC transporter ATP-binding protein [Sulfitobacter sp.]